MPSKELENRPSNDDEGLARSEQPHLSGGQNADSKEYMYLLLEQATVPTLWTVNDACSVSQDLLGRMTFALQLHPPGSAPSARPLG